MKPHKNQQKTINSLLYLISVLKPLPWSIWNTYLCSFQWIITPMAFHNFLCNTSCKTKWIYNFSAWEFLPHLSCCFPNIILLCNMNSLQRTNQIDTTEWHGRKHRNIQFIYMWHLRTLRLPQPFFLYRISLHICKTLFTDVVHNCHPG